MKIIVGAPVKGFRLKEVIKNYLNKQGHEIIDIGCYTTNRFVKYPSIGERVAWALQNHKGELAINICGSGTGAAIGIDKFSGVLACSCESVKTATLARMVNGANCLCLGEDIVTKELGCEIANAFVNTVFLDNSNTTPKIRVFWKEAHDEMIMRGVEASVREIEYL
jgi:ribose 5-phosphate isomerase B